MRDFLHHLFFPRESNNHRAKLLHHKGLLVLLIALLVIEGFFIATEKKYSGVLGETASIKIQDLLDLTNQKRAENGLPSLSISSELNVAATNKAGDMFAKNYWAHVGPDGTTPWSFIRSAGYEYVYAGENLARGYSTASDVVNAWMASPGHRDNILSNNYKDVGFAIQEGTLTGDSTVLVVQEFGSRTGGSVAQETTAIAATATPVPPSPTVVVIARVTFTPTPTIPPSPTPTPTVVPAPNPDERLLVASFTSEPLINSNSLKKQLIVGVLGILIVTLLIDVVLIERRQIIRLFVHNLDHIIFLGILLVVILIVSQGAIL